MFKLRPMDSPKILAIFKLLLCCLFASPFTLSCRPTAATGTTFFPKEALPTKSGYLAVNLTSGSSIFYAFYEAQDPTSPLPETPLLIWLQGGPGCSSMIGNFYELGPWRVYLNNSTVKLKPNKGAWNRRFGLVFLDNPIGTGFSIASFPEEIPTDQAGVAAHLFVAIRSFVELDPSFESRPIYITGESYAGKYVPAIGYYILKKNSQLSKSKAVNLAGVSIGNGLTDPIEQVQTHALNAFFVGLINEKQKTQLEETQSKVVGLVRLMKWSQATDARNELLRMLQNMTALATLYNMRRKTPYETQLVTRFLSNVQARRALGVNTSEVFEDCSEIVEVKLHGDVMKSVRYMVDFLVKETKVLLYQGQSDLRDGVVSVEAWMKKLQWEGITKFLSAKRSVWRVAGELAGYVQKWKNLSHVVVLDAGHFVPTDQAVRSQAMIEDWVLNRGLFGEDETVRNSNDGINNGSNHLRPSS